MQRVFLLILLAFLSISVSGQARPAGFDLSNYGVRIEPDRRLMIVLSTLEMAGNKGPDGKVQTLLNAPLSAGGMKFREQLMADTADLPDDLRLRITNFVSQYKRQRPKATDAEIIAPFISMAYALTPAPELADPVITADLPGSLLDVLDFAPLVREVYRRSTISSKLDGYVKDYRQQSDGQLRRSTQDMVSEILDYLHTRPQLYFTEKTKVETAKVGSKTEKITTTEVRERERRFNVVPEALAPRGAINFLNIRDDYYLVLPPDTDLTNSDGRRAFLRFVIDPLILANSREMTAIRDWEKPVLDELRKTNGDVTSDAHLAMSRSLVAAVDIRQSEYRKTQIATEQARQNVDQIQKNAEAQAAKDKRPIDQARVDVDKKAVGDKLKALKDSFADESTLRLYEDYQKGAVLSFYFADQLKGTEESGFDIASSLKDMIQSFDPAKETTRVASTAEARKRALAAREERKKHPATTTTVIAENPITTRLLEIQKVINARDLVKANADLKQLLTQYPAEPRIYYNLGRVAALAAVPLQDDREEQAKKLLEAKDAYTNVLKTATTQTDKTLISLTYVALARIYEFDNNDAYALKLFEEAIKLGIKEGGLDEAIAGKQRLLKPQQ